MSQDGKVNDCTVTSTDVTAALQAMAQDIGEHFPKRAFLSIEGGDSKLCDVYGFAVVGRTGDHEGWRGPTIVVVNREAGPGYDEKEAESILVSGRDALVQLRAAIDFALGDKPA